MPAPGSLPEFRIWVATELKEVGAPNMLVNTVDDLDDESSLLGAVISCWHEVELEKQDGCAFHTCGDYIHDMVIDLVAEWSNPWNFAPGEAPKFKPEDAPAWANQLRRAAERTK